MNDTSTDRPPAASTPKATAAAEPESLRAWQERLLPLMMRVVAGLTLFFFIASLAQLIYLHGHIQSQPESALAAWLSESDQIERPAGSRAATLELKVRLEHDVIARRYHVTSTLLMGQLWIRYLGFVTGMIMSMIGAVFILGKLRESTTELKASSSNLSLALTTASPGILLAVVGGGLMLATILTKQEAWVTDAAIYVPGRAAATEAATDGSLSDQIDTLRSMSTAGGE